jgi:hypothetical protein
MQTTTTTINDESQMAEVLCQFHPPFHCPRHPTIQELENQIHPIAPAAKTNFSQTECLF